MYEQERHPGNPRPRRNVAGRVIMPSGFVRAALALLCLVLAVESVYVYRFYADQDPLPGLRATAVQTESITPETTTLPTSAASAEPSRASFVHRATPTNTDGNSTYLDHPLIDGDPDAVVLVTAAWEAGGVNNARPVGVWYDADRERWAIYNQDQAPMPEGAAFNVAVSGRRSGEVTIPGSGRAGGMQVPGCERRRILVPDVG